MRLLLDTHVFLLWLWRERPVSTAARAAIADPENEVFLSMASVWEIAIKRSIGKLEAPWDVEEQLARQRFQTLQVKFAHADAVGRLPLLHRDPFDRMLVAQAQVELMTVVTRDPRIARYGVQTLTA